MVLFSSDLKWRSKEYAYLAKRFDMIKQMVYEVSEVSRAIEAVTVTISQSADGTEEIAKGTSDTSQSLDSVKGPADNLTRTATNLNQLIGKFKI